jgi:hypothetical protein
MAYIRGDMGVIIKDDTELIKTLASNNKKAGDYSKAAMTSPADAVSSRRDTAVYCVSLIARAL